MKLPIVLLPACTVTRGDHVVHEVGRKYVDAVRFAGALPLIVPPMAADDIDALLDLAHGVMLTGSPSNIDPSHYGEPVLDPSLPQDPARDAWSLPLVPRALARGVPLLAICRGMQEVNVALGGTLHQAVQTVDGYHDHRADDDADVDLQYGPAHAISIEPAGLLHRLLGVDRVLVNSLHGQGVSRLARGLQVEARSPDGVIEAFSMPAASGFNLAVQWHPEWRLADNPVSVRLFEAFGAAVRRYRELSPSPSSPYRGSSAQS